MFFFFNQKTTYEMRISDWSSDVCSSDLRHHDPDRLLRDDPGAECPRHQCESHRGLGRGERVYPERRNPARLPVHRGAGTGDRAASAPGPLRFAGHEPPLPQRSEEHTSELQSLMRISSAVFCLKKTNNTTAANHAHNNTIL